MASRKPSSRTGTRSSPDCSIPCLRTTNRQTRPRHTSRRREEWTTQHRMDTLRRSQPRTIELPQGREKTRHSNRLGQRHRQETPELQQVARPIRYSKKTSRTPSVDVDARADGKPSFPHRFVVLFLGCSWYGGLL